jgi:hypothetical protein
VAGQHRTQLGQVGGDHGVRARPAAAADGDQPHVLTGDLPPDPEARELFLQLRKLLLAGELVFVVARDPLPAFRRQA